MNSRKNRGASRLQSSSLADSSIVLLIAVSMVSFFAGTIFTAHMNMECIGGVGGHHFMDAEVEELVQKRLRSLQSFSDRSESISSESRPSLVKFPKTTRNYAQAMVRVPKAEFFEQFDIGVPMDPVDDPASEVLILYNHEKALPSDDKKMSKISDDSSFPQLNTVDAVENCEYLHVILADHGKSKSTCTAIVPNYESYHVQKWMRLGDKGLDSTKGFSLVSRGIRPNGRNEFRPPLSAQIRNNWEILKKYFESFDEVTNELKPLLEKVATPKNTVTVMVSNFGQSELLINFVCAAKSRNLDISSIIVFATDLETKELAEGLGLVAFYDKWNYSEIPSEAAGQYADKKFTAMMLAKVMCIQMVSSLGYNILFQDVDIVWYKNPILFFEAEDSGLEEFDMMFQDDGGHSIRYAPYSANSGFYYVRSNAKTKYFFSNLLAIGDQIIQSGSHQQALISLLSEHSSLYGTKVKIFSRDTDEFPGGFHYHQKSRKYMKRFFAGEADPYIFHMSWTFNKNNKLLFFQQLEEWYVKDQCVHKEPDQIPRADGSENDFAAACCLAEPVFKCHYSDKPSKFPCNDSPPIDKGGKPFWKPGEFKGEQQQKI